MTSLGSPVAGTPFSSSRPVALGPAADTVDTKRLRFLLAGLDQGMARISTGVWHEDFGLVEQGAASIANHPQISPDQIAKIKQVLSEEFQNFVRFGKTVHGTAPELVIAAEAREWFAMLNTYTGLPDGYFGCRRVYTASDCARCWRQQREHDERTQRVSSPQSSGAPAPARGIVDSMAEACQ